jgi:hypothetical protein
VVSIVPQVVAVSLVEATPEMAEKNESDEDDGEGEKPEMNTAAMRGRKGDSADEVSERWKLGLYPNMRAHIRSYVHEYIRAQVHT